MDNQRCTIEMLGGFRIRRNGEDPVDLPRQQVGALLAYLALHPQRQHTREELAEALWPSSGEEAKQRLRQTLYALRKLLSDFADELILVSKAGIQLNQDRVLTDVAALRQAVRRAGHSSDLEERRRLLSTAAAAYRGPLLPGFYQDWAIREQDRLAEQNRAALRALAATNEQLGDLSRAIETVERLIALDPLAEDAYCQAMKLYAASGRPADVLRAYRDLERTLRSELQDAPTPETTRLMETLRNSGRAVASRFEAPSEVSASHRQLYTNIADPKSDAALLVDGPLGEPRAVAGQRIAPSEAAAYPDRIPGVRRSRGGLLLFCAGLFVVLVWLTAVRGRSRPAAPVPGGTLEWAWIHEGAPGDKDMEVSGLAADAYGNVYLTGFVQTPDRDVDMVTVKLGPDGDKIWEDRYDGPLHDCDRARSITLDRDGSVIVTGDSWNGDLKAGRSGWDFVTVKYSADGRRVWARRWSRPEWRGDDMPVKVAASPAGEVYVTGTSYDMDKSDPTRRSAISTIKYSADGRLLWETAAYNPEMQDTVAFDMALSVRGMPIVVGTGTGWNKTGLCLMAYAADGKPQTAHWFGKAGGAVHPTRIATDTSANIYISGYLFNGDPALGGTGNDALILKFTRDLRPAWEQLIASPFHSQFNGVFTDSRGVVHAGGVHADEFTLASYASDGKKANHLELKGPSGNDTCKDLQAAAGEGHVAAGFTSTRSPSTGEFGADAVVLRFDSNGRQLWHAQWDNPSARKGDVATHVTSDRSGNVLAAGMTQDGAHQRLLVLKFAR